MADDLREQTVRGVAWSFVERFSVQGITFILELVIARLVGPDNFGLIAMLAIFMSVSQVFIDGGFSSALIQRQQRSEAD
ncbi:MAG: oligosaccharide flippase family protein, partial [Muribaculaceae bacterium]|nr:oligosaccharide flippase family protein [Muribaculaceae bacterium]